MFYKLLIPWGKDLVELAKKVLTFSSTSIPMERKIVTEVKKKGGGPVLNANTLIIYNWVIFLLLNTIQFLNLSIPSLISLTVSLLYVVS